MSEIKSVNTDVLMQQTYNLLHADLFQHTATLPQSNIVEIRKVSYEIPRYASPYVVKCKAQLAGWLKRYRFKSDVLSDAELEKRTDDKMFADLLRVGAVKGPLSFRTTKVLQLARCYIKRVLGQYNEEEILPYCQFSRNGTVGFSGEDVYLDRKIFPGCSPSGTLTEHRWFKQHLLGDRVLWQMIAMNYAVTPNVIGSLKQVNVPKTALIKRPVCPNSLIGSYRSIGIGELIREKMSDAGIDLNHLQEEHRRLAKRASRRMHLVTADIAGGSLNFTSSIMNRLYPRDWFCAMKYGRTSYMDIGDRTVWSPAFMAMGIGFTFTAMSLAFHAILLAIRQLSKLDGRISVFGDDLIYPIKMHHYVVGVFNDLNIPINMDKTFTDLPFRESCGGDYYDHVDVRPARPEGVSELLAGNAIAAYVYKLFNSLIRRWEEVELPLTFAYLRSVLTSYGFEIFSVPSHFPDSSGVKDGNWREFCKREIPSSDRRKPFYFGSYIPCLVERTHLRRVEHQGIYYWESLQKGSASTPEQLIMAAWDRIRKLRNPHESWEPKEERTVLIWRKEKKAADSAMGQVSKGYRKLVAHVTQRDSHYYSLGKTLL